MFLVCVRGAPGAYATRLAAADNPRPGANDRMCFSGEFSHRARGIATPASAPHPRPLSPKGERGKVRMAKRACENHGHRLVLRFRLVRTVVGCWLSFKARPAWRQRT